jgi:cobalt-zinc-cadmium efflux system membrane fusion protein
MKKLHMMIVMVLIMVPGMMGCNSNQDTLRGDRAQMDQDNQKTANTIQNKGQLQSVFLTDLQFNSLGMRVDSLPVRTLTGVVEANGHLRVPPQHEATLTAILGANVYSIHVLEGEQIADGQILAYLTHPDLTRLQTGYVKRINEKSFLEEEYLRQKRLYEEEVGSGKEFQKIKAEYQAILAEVKGYEIQLKQLNLDPVKIRNGDIYESVPVLSPMDGFIKKVMIQIGQYVEPQKELFMIVNTDYIHADLMVFEKDIHKVRNGQQVYFTVESLPGKILSAKIFSVGRHFEQNPKAVHIHAEIDKKDDMLIPGMYINGKIHTDHNPVRALPEEAIARDGDNSYIFPAEKQNLNSDKGWIFQPVAVVTGLEDGGWVEVRLLDPLLPGSRVAWNNAYYLIAEMEKGETPPEH